MQVLLLYWGEFLQEKELNWKSVSAILRTSVHYSLKQCLAGGTSCVQDECRRIPGLSSAICKRPIICAIVFWYQYFPEKGTRAHTNASQELHSYRSSNSNTHHYAHFAHGICQQLTTPLFTHALGRFSICQLFNMISPKTWHEWFGSNYRSLLRTVSQELAMLQLMPDTNVSPQDQCPSTVKPVADPFIWCAVWQVQRPHIPPKRSEPELKLEFRRTYGSCRSEDNCTGVVMVPVTCRQSLVT